MMGTATLAGLLALETLRAEGPAGSARYDEIILRYSQLNGLNPRLVKAVIAAESEFKNRAVSPAGARGLMQLMPKTSVFLETPVSRLHDPESNIAAGTKYLAMLCRAAAARHSPGSRRCADAPTRVVWRAVAAYHAGPRALELPSERWPAATRVYARKVLRLSRAPLSAVSGR